LEKANVVIVMAHIQGKTGVFEHMNKRRALKAARQFAITPSQAFDPKSAGRWLNRENMDSCARKAEANTNAARVPATVAIEVDPVVRIMSKLSNAITEKETVIAPENALQVVITSLATPYPLVWISSWETVNDCTSFGSANAWRIVRMPK
jgi:hypothetical protein